MRTLCTYSFQPTIIHLIYCKYQGMNYGRDTNISLSLSEGDLKIVSYIYTKTSSIVLINNPQKILLNIKEMNSLGWNIHGQTFFMNNCNGFRIDPRFGFVIIQKIIKFLLFSSWQRFRLKFNFHWWCGKLCFR